MHTRGCLFKRNYCEFKSEYGRSNAIMEEIEKHIRLKREEVVMADNYTGFINEYKVIYKSTSEYLY